MDVQSLLLITNCHVDCYQHCMMILSTQLAIASIAASAQQAHAPRSESSDHCVKGPLPAPMVHDRMVSRAGDLRWRLQCHHFLRSQQESNEMGPLSSRFSIFSDRDYALYALGNSLSSLGMWAQRVGVGWMSWDLSHSAYWVGLVSLGQFLPLVLFAPLFGGLLDRCDPRRYAIIANVALGMVAGALFVVAAQNALSIERLCAFSVLLGVANSSYHPVRLTLGYSRGAGRPPRRSHRDQLDLVQRRSFARACACWYCDCYLWSFSDVRFQRCLICGNHRRLAGYQGTCPTKKSLAELHEGFCWGSSLCDWPQIHS